MKTVRMVVVLSCMALLALSSIPMGVSKNTAKASAAQTTIDEVEPNEDPTGNIPVEEFAQEIPFPAPGETIVLQGSVQAGDRGGFSEELETFFSFAGGIGELQDWYVIDPDADGNAGSGPIPLKISVGWDSQADLDIYAGLVVDNDLFFFDGFKNTSGFDMGTLANPETWPNTNRNGNGESLAFYLQPSGITVEGEPIPNDGFGRKIVIGIQHFEGPAANYTLTIERASEEAEKQGRVFASETHKVDDGGITTRWFSGPQGGIILNRYKPTRYPATLTAIAHPFVWFNTVPDPTNQPIRVLILAGDDDSPNAAPPLLSNQGAVLYDQMIMIPGTISPRQGSRSIDRVVQIPIDPPITVNSGVVYVGLAWPNRPIAETGIALALDISPVQYLRSYLSTDGGATWGRPVQQEDLSGEDVFLNADIRAFFTFGASASSAQKTGPQVRPGVEVQAGSIRHKELKMVNLNH